MKNGYRAGTDIDPGKMNQLYFFNNNIINLK